MSTPPTFPKNPPRSFTEFTESPDSKRTSANSLLDLWESALEQGAVLGGNVLEGAKEAWNHPNAQLVRSQLVDAAVVVGEKIAPYIGMNEPAFADFLGQERFTCVFGNNPSFEGKTYLECLKLVREVYNPQSPSGSSSTSLSMSSVDVQEIGKRIMTAPISKCAYDCLKSKFQYESSEDEENKLNDITSHSEASFADRLKEDREWMKIQDSSLGHGIVIRAGSKVAAKTRTYFDPFYRGNYPFLVGTREVNGHKCEILRHALPVYEQLGKKEEIVGEYKAFLSNCKNEGKKVLYCNLLNPMASDESPRIQLLRDLAQDAEYKDVFHVLEIPADGYLTNAEGTSDLKGYAQLIRDDLAKVAGKTPGRFVASSPDVKEFIRENHAKIVNFSLNQINVTYARELSRLDQDSREYKELLKEAKQAFLMLLSSVLRAGLINAMKINYCNSTCKDAIDRGAMHLTSDLLWDSFLTGTLKENEENIRVMAVWPAFMAKTQAVLEDRAEWMESFANFIEKAQKKELRDAIVRAYCEELGLSATQSIAFSQPIRSEEAEPSLKKTASGGSDGIHFAPSTTCNYKSIDWGNLKKDEIAYQNDNEIVNLEPLNSFFGEDGFLDEATSSLPKRSKEEDDTFADVKRHFPNWFCKYMQENHGLNVAEIKEEGSQGKVAVYTFCRENNRDLSGKVELELRASEFPDENKFIVPITIKYKFMEDSKKSSQDPNDVRSADSSSNQDVSKVSNEIAEINLKDLGNHCQTCTVNGRVVLKTGENHNAATERTVLACVKSHIQNIFELSDDNLTNCESGFGVSVQDSENKIETIKGRCCFQLQKDDDIYDIVVLVKAKKPMCEDQNFDVPIEMRYVLFKHQSVGKNYFDQLFQILVKKDGEDVISNSSLASAGGDGVEVSASDEEVDKRVFRKQKKRRGSFSFNKAWKALLEKNAVSGVAETVEQGVANVGVGFSSSVDALRADSKEGASEGDLSDQLVVGVSETNGTGENGATNSVTTTLGLDPNPLSVSAAASDEDGSLNETSLPGDASKVTSVAPLSWISNTQMLGLVGTVGVVVASYFRPFLWKTFSSSVGGFLNRNGSLRGSSDLRKTDASNSVSKESGVNISGNTSSDSTSVAEASTWGSFLNVSNPSVDIGTTSSNSSSVTQSEGVLATKFSKGVEVNISGNTSSDSPPTPTALTLGSVFSKDDSSGVIEETSSNSSSVTQSEGGLATNFSQEVEVDISGNMSGDSTSSTSVSISESPLNVSNPSVAVERAASDSLSVVQSEGVLVTKFSKGVEVNISGNTSSDSPPTPTALTLGSVFSKDDSSGVIEETSSSSLSDVQSSETSTRVSTLNSNRRISVSPSSGSLAEESHKVQSFAQGFFNTSSWGDPSISFKIAASVVVLAGVAYAATQIYNYYYPKVEKTVEVEVLPVIENVEVEQKIAKHKSFAQNLLSGISNIGNFLLRCIYSVFSVFNIFRK